MKPYKLSKKEIIWLIVTLILFLAYNIPGVPAYHSRNGMFIHALLTVAPLWIFTYIALPAVLRNYPLRSPEEVERLKAELHDSKASGPSNVKGGKNA